MSKTHPEYVQWAGSLERMLQTDKPDLLLRDPTVYVGSWGPDIMAGGRQEVVDSYVALTTAMSTFAAMLRLDDDQRYMTSPR